MAYQYRNNGRNGNGCGCQGENGSGRMGRDGNYPAGGRFGEGQGNDGHRGDGRMNNGIMNDGRVDGGRSVDCGCAGNGSRNGDPMGGPQGIIGFAGTDGPVAPVPQDAALAMAYVPVQPWGEIYDPGKALQHGTIFADLDKPFSGEKARCGK